MIEIVTLGTGAAVPGLFRNHSSTALIHDGDIILFDCGEATQHQIQKAKLRHSKIKAVFISHVHGDHIFGLMGLITTMSLNGRTSPLAVYGPEGIKKYLKNNLEFSGTELQYPLDVTEISKTADIEVNGHAVVSPVELRHTTRTFGFKYTEKEKPGKFDVEKARALSIPQGPLYGKLQKGEPIEMDGKTIHPEDVLGPPRKGTVVSYCLDTEPCKGGHKLAKGADLLIHDATYKDEDVEFARRGRHSTHGEAIKLALKHDVKTLVLTHFSQRYLEYFKDTEVDGMKVIYAYDGMRMEV